MTMVEQISTQGVLQPETRRTTDEALLFIKMMKETFSDKPELYDEFRALMKDFSARRIDTGFVVTRAKELFKGHPKLIIGFNAFLPDGHKLSLEPEDKLEKERGSRC